MALSAQRGQTGANRGDELGMGDGAEPQERAVVFDGGCRVAGLVSDHCEVVMRSGAARTDRERTPQQIARVGDAAARPLHERQVDERLDVARIRGQRDAELRRGNIGPARSHVGDAEVVVRFHGPGIDGNRPLKLLDRVVQLIAILIQQTEVVVHLGVRVVLLEQNAVLRERAVEVAGALEVQRPAEMVHRGRRGRRSRLGLDDSRRYRPRHA